MSEQKNIKYNSDDIKSKVYYFAVFIFCIISVWFAIKDFTRGLSFAEAVADKIIYGLFVGDYIIRFIVAGNKRIFFKDNIFDLLAIIPFNSVLRAFRLLRFTKLLRLTKLFRVGRLFSRSSKFLNTNGFKYVILLSISAILAAAIAMTQFEKMGLADALWWSFVTTTTVGYGDLSPTTTAGRITASVLMIIGIGLIGSLTSTITSFFLKSEDDKYSTDKIEMVMQMYDMLSDKEKEEVRTRLIN